MSRKISILLVLVLCFTMISSSVFADTGSGNIKPDNKKFVKVVINSSTVEANLDQYVEDGLLTAEYAQQVLEIVNKYTAESSGSSTTGEVTTNYYDPDTGAEIYWYYGIREVWFNKAGWAIIEEIINLGGSATTIGLTVAALCGVASSITGPVAALAGAVFLGAKASVKLQFAMGAPYAILKY
ncbi:MAG: hypothetical protein A2Y23_10175 [Clostridiales bacterium GWB2_37_7]|nr:MAG: hypothetical protein A2Y23_10175 [Clostridiales bacterium GWB2_37_7]